MVTTSAKTDLAKEIEAQAQEWMQFWRLRNFRWAKTRSMLAGTYWPKLPKIEQWISNEPRTLFDLSVSILAGKAPLFNMPINNKPPVEREATSKAERLADGMMREISRGYRRRLHGGWLYELMWYICSGGYSVFPHIAEGKDGNLRFFCDIWDPMDVYPAMPGEDGLTDVYRVYRTEWAAIQGMAESNGWDVDALEEVRPRGGNGRTPEVVQVTNRWWVEKKKVYNAVIVAGAEVKEKTHEDQFSRIPVIVGTSAGVPFRQFNPAESWPIPAWQEEWGQSVIDANFETYKALDRLLSYKMQIAHDHAFGTMLDINEQGVITVEPGDAERLRVVPRKIGEDFKRVEPPRTPVETNELLTYGLSSTQRGGLSHVAFGSLGLDISGVTLQQLLTATRSKLLPYQITGQDVLSEVVMELLDQFVNIGKPVELDVRARSMGPGMGYIIESFSPDDMPKTPYVEAILPLALPDDTMERIQMAQQAMGGREPIMDWVTMADTIMRFQDPETILDRMEEDTARRNPAVKAVETIAGLRSRAEIARLRGQMKTAALLEQVAEAVLAQVGAMIGGGGGGPNAEGTPRTMPEPTPGIQSAEAGPLSPDRFNVAFGRPATPPTRGVTAQDRLRNMGLSFAGR